MQEHAAAHMFLRELNYFETKIDGSKKLWFDPKIWYKKGKEIDQKFCNAPYIETDMVNRPPRNDTGLYELITDDALQLIDPSWSVWKKMVHRALLLDYLGRAYSLEKRSNEHNGLSRAPRSRLIGKPKHQRYLEMREFHGGKRMNFKGYHVKNWSYDLFDKENLIIFMLKSIRGNDPTFLNKLATGYCQRDVVLSADEKNKLGWFYYVTNMSQNCSFNSIFDIPND